ncbi:MAG: hypothetical protein QOE64_1941 [Frankiales bacterium]|nr:hypothetical protein [Frankiales bacterium]
MAFRELLRAPWWLWLAAFAVAALLGLEVGVATNAAIGGLTALGVSVGLGAGLHRSTLVLEVSDGELRAGAARAPLSAFGSVVAHDPRTLRLRRGRDADPAAFLALRPWVHTAVELAVTDPTDPTPYWLVATKRADELVAVLAKVP